MTEFSTPFSNLKNKTGKHKDWYGPEFIEILCKEVNPKGKFFENKKFVAQYKKESRQLELKERLNLIASMLNENLPSGYKKKIQILTPLLGEPWPYEEGMFNRGFYLYPISQFIENYGTEDIDLSLDFIEQLTMRFTGEFAIRPLANLDEKKVLRKMKEWSKHKNFHVRRLSSEGLRARLPWGASINWINEKPEKSLPIYSKLRNDKVLYVRRSVANSIGDLIKLDEDLALQTIEKWLDSKKTADNLWVIKHAIRTPVKKKNEKFLKLKKEIELLRKNLS